MTDPILTKLTTLRDAYALHLARLELSDMDPLFRRVNMKQMRDAIAELDRQIARCEEEQEERQPLHCDVTEAKRYADTHEQE